MIVSGQWSVVSGHVKRFDLREEWDLCFSGKKDYFCLAGGCFQGANL